MNWMPVPKILQDHQQCFWLKETHCWFENKVLKKQTSEERYFFSETFEKIDGIITGL